MNQFEVTIKFTEYIAHGTELAKTALQNGFDIVAAAGGDGTINEVGSQLINTEQYFLFIIVKIKFIILITTLNIFCFDRFKLIIIIIMRLADFSQKLNKLRTSISVKSSQFSHTTTRIVNTNFLKLTYARPEVNTLLLSWVRTVSLKLKNKLS